MMNYLENNPSSMRCPQSVEEEGYDWIQMKLLHVEGKHTVSTL
jgi:hypothetical protein